MVIRNLMGELGGALAELVKRPTLLLGDNDPATKLAKEMKATSKTKHWLLKYHLCRQNFQLQITLPLRTPGRRGTRARVQRGEAAWGDAPSSSRAARGARRD